MHVSLIAVVGVAPKIAIITLVLTAVNVTSIVPFGAADARAQGKRAGSRLLAAVAQAKQQTNEEKYTVKIRTSTIINEH